MNVFRIRALNAINLRVGQLDNNAMGVVKEALCLGTMAGSAAGSTVLCPSRTVWYLDLSIFGLSFGWFVGRHWKAVKIYGPLVFPPGALLSLGFSVLSDVSPAGFAAWIPVVMCLFILLTVHSLPPVLPHLLDTSERRTVLGNTLSIVSVEPGSIQDVEECGAREDPITHFLLYHAREQDFAHMRPTSRASPTPSSRDSDIELEDPQDQMDTSNITSARMVSQTTMELDSGFFRSFWKDGQVPGRQSVRYRDDSKDCSSPPDSPASDCHPSSPAVSNTPLLV